jgi:hypothetical protein
MQAEKTSFLFGANAPFIRSFMRASSKIRQVGRLALHLL